MQTTYVPVYSSLDDPANPRLRGQFTRAYLSKRASGRRLAALDLRNKLRSFVRKREREHYGSGAASEDVEVKVIVQSFMNLRELSTFLGNKVDLASFVQGFNPSGFSLSMTDCGPLAQSADVALKGASGLSRSVDTVR